MTHGDYVLGTRDEEIERLGIQHAAWRIPVFDCWRRVGISPGSRVLDVGAGPGYASLDLARVVGPTGSVTAVERAERFVDAGRARAREQDCTNVTFCELDLMVDPLPEGPFDAAWCRWVCSFVDEPEVLIGKVASVLRPGGIFALHEYVDYASWRFSPRRPALEEYVARVMTSWRTAGGEPDVAMSLPPMLRAAGFEIREAVPRVYCVKPGDRLWRWISTFMRLNFERLLELGAADAEWIDRVRAEFSEAEVDPTTLMLTPMVLEIIAERN